MAEAIISQEGNTSSDWSIAELNYTIDDDWANINTNESFMGIIDPVYTNQLSYIAARATSPPAGPIYLAAKFIN